MCLRGRLLTICLLVLPAIVSAQDATVAGRTYSYAFVDEGGGDAEGIARLDAFIQQRLRNAGLLADGKGDGRIEVTVTHYYARSDGARAWAGIMAGRDKVASRVRVLDRGGNPLDEFEIENSNKTAFGSTAGLHEKHADAIVERLRELGSQ